MKAKYYQDTMVGEGIVADLFNKVIDKTQRFPGERHTALMTDKGPRIASYTGPNTRLDIRLRSQNPKIINPLGPTDRASMRHDLDYALATNTEDIRKADQRMLDKLKDIENKNLDYKVNTKVVSGLMKSKTLIEDTIGKRGELFSGIKKGQQKKNTLSLADQSLFEKKRTELEMLGYGYSGQYNLFEAYLQQHRKNLIKNKL